MVKFLTFGILASPLVWNFHLRNTAAKKLRILKKLHLAKGVENPSIEVLRISGTPRTWPPFP